MGDQLPALDLAGRPGVDTSARWVHACARLEYGSAKCWGSGMHGKVGYGDSATQGNVPGLRDDQLHALDLAGRTVNDISAGLWHTCARLEDGSA